jgi:hypothetical protein
MVVICKHCNKEFSSYSSRSNHNKKFHTKIEECKLTSPTQKCIPKESLKKRNILECKYCKKIYSNRQNRWKHEQKCDKNNEELDEELDDILKEAVNKEIEKFKADFFKAMKVHPKTANKINNQINSNNTINNTINNINLVIPLGKENFNDVLSDAQKVSIVKANEKAIYKFTEIIYTDPALEKYRNVSITNINGDHANTYDEKFAKYVLNKKLEIINKYGWNRLCDIEEFIADLENKNIDVGNIDKLTVLIDRYAKDDEFKKIFNNELVILLYNYNRYVKRNLKKINKEIEI